MTNLPRPVLVIQFAQELLSTFSTALGEVALQPATGGVFVVEITTSAAPASSGTAAAPTKTLLWDRKLDGGFPETKELKRRVRDVIAPGRDLGHVDREYPKGKGEVKGGGEVVGDGGKVKEDGGGQQQQQQQVGAREVEVDAGTGTGKACGLEGGRCEDCE